MGSVCFRTNKFGLKVMMEHSNAHNLLSKCAPYKDASKNVMPTAFAWVENAFAIQTTRDKLAKSYHQQEQPVLLLCFCLARTITVLLVPSGIYLESASSAKSAAAQNATLRSAFCVWMSHCQQMGVAEIERNH